MRYPPLATWTLIALNCLVFFIEVNLSESALIDFITHFALVPARLFSDSFGSLPSDPAAFLTLGTNMFLHGGWLHLILNMWTLWLFGPAVEDRLGVLRYVIFYLACGVLASITHAVFNPSSSEPALGASGAIAGLLGAYIRLFPRAQVIVLVPLLFFPFFFDMPAIFFALFWFAMQALQGTAMLFSPAAGGAIAWWAHVGGFLAGLALVGPLSTARLRRWAHYSGEDFPGFDLVRH